MHYIVGDVDALKSGAAECIAIYACNAVRDRYTFEVFAVFKGMIAYLRNTVGNYNALKPRVAERVITYTRHAVRERYALEVFAVLEGIIADACNAFGNDIRFLFKASRAHDKSGLVLVIQNAPIRA